MDKLKQKSCFEAVYLSLMLVSALAFCVLFSYRPLFTQLTVFFGQTNDFMADFINVGKYSTAPSPYIDPINGLGEKAYLPLAYVLLSVFARFFPFNIQEFDVPDNLGLTVMLLFLTFISTLMFIQLYDFKSGTKLVKILTCITFFGSSIFIFSFERGNLITISIVMLIFFLANYKSENKVLRELSFIALAISATLKGYPALFGLLLLLDRRYFEAFRLVIYGVVFAFLPFLFFDGGLSNIPQFLRNIRENTANYRLGDFKRFGLSYIFIVPGSAVESKLAITDICEPITKALVLISLILTPFIKKHWKLIGLLICVLIMMPVNSALYNGMYLFPVIVLFLNESDHPLIDYIYILLFALLLTPLQFGDISYSIANIAALLLWLSLIFSGFTDLKRFISLKIKQRKVSSTERQMA